MKANDTTSDSANIANTVGKRQSHATTFSKVLDGRKQPIRGLWERNGRYYAQITLENQISGEKTVRRVPLKDKDGNPVETVPQALGHKDGGVLIGKVYGHLANEHRKAMAKKVSFESLSVQEAVNA